MPLSVSARTYVCPLCGEVLEPDAVKGILYTSEQHRAGFHPDVDRKTQPWKKFFEKLPLHPYVDWNREAIKGNNGGNNGGELALNSGVSRTGGINCQMV